MLNVYRYEGKKIEDIKNKICEELNEAEENLIIQEKETKTGLFKNKKIQVVVLKKEDVINYIKEYIKKICELMNIDINFEVKKRDNNILFLLHSNQNRILIGKSGRTLEALQTIIKQSIYNLTDIYINFSLDVGDYKEKQLKNLERLVRNIARNVAKTKIEAKLDSMNSYERRIVHTFKR